MKYGMNTFGVTDILRELGIPVQGGVKSIPRTPPYSSFEGRSQYPPLKKRRIYKVKKRTAVEKSENESKNIASNASVSVKTSETAFPISEKLRLDPEAARLGFVMSEILSPPLSKRRR